MAHYHYLIGELAKAPSVSKTYIHHVINRKAHHTYKHLSTHTTNDKRLKKATSACSKWSTIPPLQTIIPSFGHPAPYQNFVIPTAKLYFLQIPLFLKT